MLDLAVKPLHMSLQDLDETRKLGAGLDMTCPFNLLPQLPALSLPAGIASNGLPVGLQIIGRRFSDEQVLSFGAAIEGSS